MQLVTTNQTSELAQLTALSTHLRTLKKCAKEGGLVVLNGFMTGVIGSSSPLAIVAQKIAGIYLALYTSQVYGTVYSGRTKDTISMFSVVSRIGDYESDSSLIAYLQKQASLLGINAGISIEPLANTNENLMSTHAVSFLPFKRIQLNPILFYSPRIMEQSYRYNVKGPERQHMQKLRSNPAYAQFIGTQAVVHIAKNSILQMEGIHTFSLIGFKLLIDAIASGCQLDQSGWSYLLASGLTTKFLADLMKAMYHRSMVYSYDKKIVQLTGDLRSATQCLKIIEQAPTQPRNKFVELLKFILSDQEKIVALTPSIQNRIQHLDPSGEFSAAETIDVSDGRYGSASEKELLEFYRNSDDIQLYKRLISLAASSALLLKKIGKKLVTKLPIWYSLGIISSPILFVGISSIAALAAFYPHLLEEGKQYIPKVVRQAGSIHTSTEAYPCEQRQLDIDAQEMGIIKPVQLRHPSNESVPFESLGVRQGPGSAVVFINPFLGLEKDEMDFVRRHELAHIYHGDHLTRIVIYLGAILLMHYIINAIVGDAGGVGRGMMIDAFASAMFFLGSRFMEQRADRTAVLSSQDQQRRLAQGGISFFQKLQKGNLQVRDANPFTRLFISPTGENRTDLEHPSIQSRMSELDSLSKRS